MLEKISAYINVLEAQETSTHLEELETTISSKFYYSVLYSTNINECFDKDNYISIHYALMKSFSVKLLKTEEKILVKEHTFFIAKSAANYKLLQNEESICCIISFLIKKEYFATELLSLLNENHGLTLFLNDGESNYSNPDLSSVSIIEKEYFHKLLDTIPLHNASSQKLYTDYLNLIIKRILLYIDYHFNANISDSLSLKSKVKIYMNEHMDTASLPDLAIRLNYTTAYLSQKIYHATGKKFSELLKEERMKKGKKLLEETKLPIRQICRLIGYEHDSSFISNFTEEYKVSPSAYRSNQDYLK
ncbi:MAG: helix-turn-helix transcriptional regulator [Phascolarctobacterium sp.]|nr:helix-turn-helix transcriptional regulator [Phascolarctobacterium sp.]